MSALITQNLADPSLVIEVEDDDGDKKLSYYDVYFEKEINLEFRNVENHESLSRMIRLRILTFRPDAILKKIRFEILDDSDLYFFVESIFDAESFEKLKKEMHLLIDFDEFPKEVESLVEESQTGDTETQINFIEEKNGNGILEFVQILELRSVEVFRLHFVQSDPELIQQQVQYRFNQMSALLNKQKAILSEFNKQLQSKNPVLLKAVNTPTRSPRSLRSPKKSPK